jgi:hypothetical protein
MLSRSLLAFLLIAASAPASARCYSIWHYHTPQMCGQGRIAYKVWHVSALPRHAPTLIKVIPEQKVTTPSLENIDWGRVGDDRLKGIAQLRALSDGPR